MKMFSDLTEKEWQRGLCLIRERMKHLGMGGDMFIDEKSEVKEFFEEKERERLAKEATELLEGPDYHICEKRQVKARRSVCRERVRILRQRSWSSEDYKKLGAIGLDLLCKNCPTYSHLYPGSGPILRRGSVSWQMDKDRELLPHMTAKEIALRFLELII
jgi:hypothetical protein